VSGDFENDGNYHHDWNSPENPYTIIVPDPADADVPDCFSIPSTPREIVQFLDRRLKGIEDRLAAIETTLTQESAYSQRPQNSGELVRFFVEDKESVLSAVKEVERVMRQRRVHFGG
jgi:hypothetical protein